MPAPIETFHYEGQPDALDAIVGGDRPRVIRGLVKHWPLVEAARESDRAFAAQLIGYWSRFASTADPNGGGAPSWPRYDAKAERYLELDVTSRASAALRTTECDLWDRIDKY